MLEEKELIFHLVREQEHCEFSLRYALQKEKNLWKNSFAMLILVKKGTRKEICHDYGECVLGERLLNVEDGLGVISDLFGKGGEENAKLTIPDYDGFVIQRRDRIQFVPSKHSYHLLRNPWPMRFCEFKVKQDQIAQEWSRELLKEGLPYYPDVGEAIIDFFGLEVDYFNSYGTVYVVVIDYRAKIEALKLLFSRVELTLDSPELDLKNLLIKGFAKSGPNIASPPDIYPESEKVEFDVGFQPDTLSAILLCRKDSIKIDEKRFRKWSIEEEGIFLERPEEEIFSLSRAGESQNLEYKYDLIDDAKKNDFIETVVAFLNTNRGTILVGLDDHGNILGTQKSSEDIQKLTHDGCDPPPKGIRIEEKEIEHKKVIIVEVPEGEDKPYQSKRNRNWYIRHGSNDMKMERSELSVILKKSTERSKSSGF